MDIQKNRISAHIMDIEYIVSQIQIIKKGW